MTRFRPAVAALALVLVVPFGGAWSAAPHRSEDETARALELCAPQTYEAALDCLDRFLPADVQARLAAPDGPLEAHFGLGMWIRNNWGLWGEGPLYRSMREFGIENPDDMSGAILDGFAARERGEPFDVAANAAAARAEADRMWDQAVREGRAGTLECPFPKRPTEEQFAAAMKACADRLEGDQS